MKQIFLLGIVLSTQAIDLSLLKQSSARDSFDSDSNTVSVEELDLEKTVRAVEAENTAI